MTALKCPVMILLFLFVMMAAPFKRGEMDWLPIEHKDARSIKEVEKA